MHLIFFFCLSFLSFFFGGGGWGEKDSTSVLAVSSFNSRLTYYPRLQILEWLMFLKVMMLC